MKECGDIEGARRELTQGLALGIRTTEKAFFEDMLRNLAPARP